MDEGDMKTDRAKADRLREKVNAVDGIYATRKTLEPMIIDGLVLAQENELISPRNRLPSRNLKLFVVAAQPSQPSHQLQSPN